MELSSITELSPPTSRTVPALFGELARRFPEHEALRSTAARLTFAELYRDAFAVAKGLHARGVRRGDKVAILMGNRPEWIITDIAICMLGATMVSVNTWVTSHELHYILEHSDTKLLVAGTHLRDIDYRAIMAEMEQQHGCPIGLSDVVWQSGEAGCAFAAMVAEGRSVSDSAIEDAMAAIAPEDIAYMLYTSGSTSTPKGVPLQHYALIENMWHIGERQRLDPNDRLWLAVSLFWGFGCENAMFAIYTHGGCIVLQESFDPAEALELIERERCTVFYGTPNMTRALFDHRDRGRYDISSMRKGVTIGTPEQVQMAMDLGVSQICNIYGLTETYGNCAVTDSAFTAEERLHSVGEPLPGMEIVVADPLTHEPLDAGEIGEFKVKGYVTPGYYKDADKNVLAFDDEGYFLTGDLGYIDAQGKLYFRGRLKEMIKTGGINVSPAEVEETLRAHADVDEAYVVGIPDEKRDELVVAVVLAKGGGSVDESQLRAHCRGQLAAYKVPQRYAFVTSDELPLTTTGKLQKNRLGEFFL